MPALPPFALAGLTGSAEALFPPNDLGAPDYRATEVVPRTLAYLRALPARQRRLILLLFAFVELSAIFLIPGFRTFSRHSVTRRENAVRGYRTSRFLLVRLLGDAIKATLTMMYMSHPLALEYIGSRPCEASRRAMAEKPAMAALAQGVTP